MLRYPGIVHGKVGQMICNFIINTAFAIMLQHSHSGGCKRLGVAGDHKERVGIHRIGQPMVAQAITFGHEHLAVFYNSHRRAGQIPVGERLKHICVELFFYKFRHCIALLRLSNVACDHQHPTKSQ